MGLSIPINTTSNGDGEPVDWKALKKEVLSRLDIRKEYEALGVKLAGNSANDNGFVPCYAVDRPSDDPDTRPSAAIHARMGFYLDKGVSGKSVSFFEFAVQHGRFGSFTEAFRHYADKVGVKIGHLKRHDRGVIEQDYEYTEADGEIRYRVLRLIQATGSKTFAQQAWDGDRWVGGRGCMEGIPPLPYRLPELMASSEDDVVLFTEGEADVDRAYEAGFVATTNHEGAHNWDSTGAKFLHLLPARDYVVIPDNDEVGRKHAETVADALRGMLAGHGPSWVVKVVPLPGVPHKGDLSDWLDMGGTPDQLRALIAAAPAWEPGAKVEEPEVSEDDAKGLICTLEDVARVVSLSNWVWEKWISTEALTLVAAEPGIGKTLFMMDLHRRAYHGIAWPDGTTMNLPPGGRTLWIPADRHYKQMLKVADDFLIPRSAIAVNAEKRSEPMSGNTLMTADDLLNLERNIRLVKPYWVVIDTITQTGEYKSQDTVDAKRQYTPLQEMALRTGVPIICVTHLNAGKGVIGRRAVEKCRTVIKLSRPDLEGQPHRRRLWVDKSWDLTPPDLGVTVGEGGYEYDEHPPQEEEKADFGGGEKGRPTHRLEAHVAWLVDALGAGSGRQTDLIDEAMGAGFSRSTLFRAAKEHPLITEIVIDGRKYWQLGFQD